jgi:hypothetical protein
MNDKANALWIARGEALGEILLRLSHYVRTLWLRQKTPAIAKPAAYSRTAKNAGTQTSMT